MREGGREGEREGEKERGNEGERQRFIFDFSTEIREREINFHLFYRN